MKDEAYSFQNENTHTLESKKITFITIKKDEG